MGKYSALKTVLTGRDRDLVPMTFAEIETILGLRLPPSKRYPAWWSNNPSNNTMTREWLAAGYLTEQVDVAGEKLVFRRVRTSDSAPSASVAPPLSDRREGSGAASLRRHPIFGSMKGTLTILPGVDFTEPADPDWGKVHEG